MKLYDEKTGREVCFYVTQISTCTCKKEYEVSIFDNDLCTEFTIEASSESEAYEIAIDGYRRRFEAARGSP